MTQGILLALFLAASEAPDLPASTLASLRERVSVELVDVDRAGLPGLYQRPPKGMGGLAGTKLYLLPDGTYVYCEWADVWPLTVHDKGKWTAAGGLLVLLSDPDITWDSGVARQHILVRREKEPDEVLIVALDRDPGPAFDIVEDAEPELIVVLLSLSRSEAYADVPQARRIKAELMRRAWRPEAFADAE